MAIRTQEQLVGFGYKKQPAALTANLAASFWRLVKLNPDLPFPDLKTENDAAEMGKGDEFARNTYAVSWDTKGTFKKYLSSQMGQWVHAFGLGAQTISTGVYTIVPQPTISAGIELPYFTVLNSLRAPALDQAIVGCVIEDWSIDLNNTPGRQASMITVNYVGTGKFIQPSAIAMPALTPEVLLPASSATVSINGIDYVANTNLLTLSMTGKNNLNVNEGFFIGSGVETTGSPQSGAVRGRLEFMNRVYALTFEARFASTSSEFATLRALTVGSATVTLTGSLTDTLSVNYPALIFESAVLADRNNVATIRVTCTAQADPTLGPIVVTSQNSTIVGVGLVG